MNELTKVRLPGASIDIEADFHAWTQAQVALLRERRFGEVDLANVIEEIDSLGNEQRREIGSRLRVIGAHLLKLLCSADEYPRRGWRETILSQRADLRDLLESSPSLRRHVPELFAKRWPDMRQLAVNGLSEEDGVRVPAEPPFTWEQALDEIAKMANEGIKKESTE